MGDVSEFRSVLGQLDAVKPPGVSGSRIRKLVDFVNEHPADHKAVVDALVDQNKRSAVANKLGMLYVIDAVARAYQDEAKKPNANPGFEAGLTEIRSRAPQLMEDLAIRRQSAEQFEKMRKLLEIWSKAETFSESFLNELRTTHFREPYSTTPPGSPPARWAGLPEQASKPDPPKQAAAVPNADALFGILQNLASSKPETKPNPAQPPKPAESSGADALQQLLASKSGSAADSDPRLAALSGAKPTYQRGRDAASCGAHERNRSRSPSRQNSPTEVLQPKSRAGDATRNLSRDESLMPDRIRVFSRTLYVGAIPDRYEEKDLRKDLQDVAPIQSCVYNAERHHAFVKVHSRKDADAIRDGFEKLNREGSTVLRVKWGVGFGPRDCFDYYRGVSVIPLMRLTDADKKWSVSAEFGGTGGKPLEAGMVMEEPDIEIGAGNLGSKNIQRQRMMQQQQQQQQMMMMMMGGGMPGMMPGMPGMPGAAPGAAPGPMPGMPGAMPGAMPGGMPGGMPGMPFPMMPGFPMAPGGDNMQQMFAQMQQQMQQQQNQQGK